MSDFTPNLNLPYLLPNQAQKHVTHAESLNVLDALVQLMIASELATPPDDPTDGDIHIVSGAATGDWTGQDNNLAVWRDGLWVFLPPKQGWSGWLETRSANVRFDGSNWVDAPAGRRTDWLGINADADTTNRLSVNSGASLFNHDGTDHRLTLNKATSVDTASLVLQTGFASFAEIGLIGDDALTLKLDDGAGTLTEALRVHIPSPGTQPQLLIGTDTPIDDNCGIEVHRAGATAVFNRSAASGGAMMSFYHLGNLRGEISVGASGSIVFDGEPSITFRTGGQKRLEATADALIMHVAPRLPSYGAGSRPAAATVGAGALILSPVSGTFEPLFSDGTNWRRVSDLTLA